MKTRHLLISTTIIVLSCIILISVLHHKKEEPGYNPRSKADMTGYGINGAMQWRWERIVNPLTGTVSLNDILKAEQQIKGLNMKKSTKAFENVVWDEMGPNNVGGRTRALLIDKDDHNTIFAGAVSGGVWKSTDAGISWEHCTKGNFPNIAVSCMAQAPNGDIYFGTGEYFASSSGTPFNSGSMGHGIYKSTDKQTFQLLNSTWDSISNLYFYFVNEIAVHPTTSRLYAATSGGLYYSDNPEASWSKVLNYSTLDIAIGSDGTIFFVAGYPTCKLYKAPDGNIDSNGVISVATDDDGTGNADGKITHSYVSRMEIAISPEDPNYVYVSSINASSNGLKHIYLSTDKGETWKVIGSKSISWFNPFSHTDNSGQGFYDMVIKVFPNDKNKLLLGGVYSIWKYENESWAQLSQWYLPVTDPYFVHADHHAIVFHPDFANADNGIFYVGSDGGISQYNPDFGGFRTLNRYYNVTQFYTVGFSGDDRVIGGTQDNGTQYISGLGNSPMTAINFSGGDGGYCDISVLNPNVIYSTIYYGGLYRTDKDPHEGPQEEFDAGDGSFVTPIRLWESFNDPYSTDSVTFKHDTIFTESGDTIVYTLYPGDLAFAISKINDRPIPVVIEDDTLYIGDSIRVQDPYQAFIAFGGRAGSVGCIKIARNVLDFSAAPSWGTINLPSGSGVVQTLEVSTDGNYIYAAAGSRLYRLSNVSKAKGSPTTYDDSIQVQLIGNWSQTITSIAIQSNDPNRIIVTLGNYGMPNHVEYSTNAATTTSTTGNFEHKQGDLPEIPVYCAIIEKRDPSVVIVGTEYGAYAINDISATDPEWEQLNVENLGNVPVYMIRQQKFDNGFYGPVNSGIGNDGYIYIATHGRGIFKTEYFAEPVGIKEPPAIVQKNRSDNLKIYPNPAANITNLSYNLSKQADIAINIYNLHGKLVYNQMIQNQPAGKLNYSLNINHLNPGTYIICLNIGKKKVSSKLIIY